MAGGKGQGFRLVIVEAILQFNGLFEALDGGFGLTFGKLNFTSQNVHQHTDDIFCQVKANFVVRRRNIVVQRRQGAFCVP